MPDLKLARIPDRTPVKLTIAMLPDVHQALEDYARVYADAYGREVPVTELVPAILTTFLESDRGFARARHALVERRK
jgi:hypothetical protein